MKFELNDYHRNTTDEELIDDVKNTAMRLNKQTLTAKEYSENGRFHSTTLYKHFGTWKRVLELCGLKTQGHNFSYTFTDNDVIDDVRRVADIYHKDSITQKEYNLYGVYHSSTLMKRYDNSWNAILKMSGLGVNLNRNFTDEELFEEIERVWILLGRQPTTTDIKKGISKYSLNSYARRFGGWREALCKFVEYVNEDTGFEEESKRISKGYNISKDDKSNSKHTTSRDINLRMRFKVFLRDNFKCCICGASPATDPDVVLHVDHIKPWSKGGETVMENLQTLCSKCNLGKSDLDIL